MVSEFIASHLDLLPTEVDPLRSTSCVAASIFLRLLFAAYVHRLWKNKQVVTFSSLEKVYEYRRLAQPLEEIRILRLAQCQATLALTEGP